MTFSAVLLAGGESKRMGSDKATVDFQGAPLWRRQMALLRKLEPEKIFVSTRTKPAWLPSNVELVVDTPPSRGPLGGLTSVLARIETSHLIVLAVDMPFMTAREMQRICDLATPGCGVLPMIANRAEPLAAIYPGAAAADFSTALRSDDFSLQRLCRSLVEKDKLRIVEVSARDAELYRSVNKPGDLKEETRKTREFGA